MLASFRWYLPEDLLQIGYARSSVVMVNEAHNGWLRCVRTRLIGQRLAPVAHAVGVRYLAMEALYPAFSEEANHIRHMPPITQSYLAQPEMRTFIQSALESGWTLIPYEATLPASAT